MNVRTTARPAVWIGCMACYSEGRLVGKWYDAEGAAEVIPEGLRGHLAAHDELWCMDIDGFPAGSGEMSLSAAVQWGELFDEVGEAQWPALLAWVETGCYLADADDLPCVSEFEERHCGLWDSFADYAAQLAEGIGLIDGWPEEAQRYFNWDAWTRGLRFDHVVADAPGGGVFVVRSF